MQKIWQTSRRALNYGDKTLLMGILNATPDSFSDGGKFCAPDAALSHAEQMINAGADIIDVGGESTRPNSKRISVEEEMRRVIPIVEAIAKRFDIAVSIDTSKSEVAEAAIDSGAEIINDISGLRFDGRIGEVASKKRTGLVLMHLRGTFETMHKQEPVIDILKEVEEGLRSSLVKAQNFGVESECIALDVGIGFSKTPSQNLELIAKLDRLTERFTGFPFLVGASRKSFLGQISGGAEVDARLGASLASAAIAIWNGAKIIRAHDIVETAQVRKTVEALRNSI
jgi:dihydropteroate synthase